jgi:Fumarylacetoacetate (FAA) hydrolase family
VIDLPLVPGSEVASRPLCGPRAQALGQRRAEAGFEHWEDDLHAGRADRAAVYPGDVTLTGAPAGVGAGRGEFLKPGDVVKLWIEKIGSLTNTMI